MALGDERRASGRQMEQSRRASGQAMEDARRAGGRQMEASRRGEAMVDDINSIVRPRRQAAPLRRVDPVGPLPATRGSGVYQAPASGTGGGIASPLTEQTQIVDGKAIPLREYWPQGYMTSDGLFVLPAQKTWNMTDANGNAVVFQFADPQGTVPEADA